MAISGGLIVLLLSYIDLRSAVRVLWDADPWLILLCVLLIIAGRLLIAHRWHLLVRVSNSKIGFVALLRLTLVSGFVGFATPGAIGVELFRLSRSRQHDHAWSGLRTAIARRGGHHLEGRCQKLLDEGVYTCVSDIGDAEKISKSHVSRIRGWRCWHRTSLRRSWPGERNRG